MVGFAERLGVKGNEPVEDGAGSIEPEKCVAVVLAAVGCETLPLPTET
jgi:hypothetical protein